MKIFIKKAVPGAWEHINLGYENAFKHFGFECYYYSNLNELILEENFYLFSSDFDLIDNNNLKILKKANKVFLFIMPNEFPKHWGQHQNWLSSCKIDFNELNGLNNLVKWTFLEQCPYFYKWSKYLTLPLAFDNFRYKEEIDKNFKFDVCYVGSWANNGFDEKRKNMINHFSRLKNTNLSCGIFINKNISKNDENKLLTNSKISLNIHDTYQREFGLDTNERTFKGLGLNGILVTDKVEQIKKISKNIKMSNDPDEYLEFILDFLKDRYIEDIRQENKQNILINHTYKNRVEELLNA